ncbi:unnamed protein product [Prorocentrum cordatum]|uniref:Uncharacterized protein n=1 Tax=Prorocentrum cordatum TaxID=2364126 RepID=A0ABN9VKM1_9DINO|nr:unnamed protein product [Polarella glacialis]
MAEPPRPSQRARPSSAASTARPRPTASPCAAGEPASPQQEPPMVTITKEEYDRLHAVAASSGIREQQEPAPRLLAGPKWGRRHRPADAVDSAAPPACAPWPKAKPMPGRRTGGGQSGTASATATEDSFVATPPKPKWASGDGREDSKPTEEHDTGGAAEYCEYDGVAAQPSTASTTGDCGGEVEPNVGDAYDDHGWDEGGTSHKRRRQHSMDDDAKVPWLKQQLSKVEELLSDAGVIVMKAVQHAGEEHVAPVLLEDEVSGIPPTVRTEKMKRGGRHVRIARLMAKHVANGGDLNAVRQSADRNVHKYIEWLFQNHWNEFEEFGSAQVVWDCLRWGAS